MARRRSVIGWALGALTLLSPCISAEIPASQSRESAPDYLNIAREFADCMIQYGRDRYGKVHSPLFSNILTREKEPRTTPYPLFAEKSAQTANKAEGGNGGLTTQSKKDKKLKRLNKVKKGEVAQGRIPTRFDRFDFNKILNYPEGLCNAGPHKVTLFGCDPYEDRDLYYALFDLTRITGDPEYKSEAEKAIIWWFKNTQGPTGLYPWGEHMGWDLLYGCPTYFDGPSTHLYHASYHEVRDTVPFLEYLAALPAAKPGDYTPLEKYALGIWNAHFWDKDKAYYNRHGDYTGQDNQEGLEGAFPAHLAFYTRRHKFCGMWLNNRWQNPNTSRAHMLQNLCRLIYMRIWAAAYLNSNNPQVKANGTAGIRTGRQENGPVQLDGRQDLSGGNEDGRQETGDQDPGSLQKHHARPTCAGNLTAVEGLPAIWRQGVPGRSRNIRPSGLRHVLRRQVPAAKGVRRWRAFEDGSRRALPRLLFPRRETDARLRPPWEGPAEAGTLGLRRQPQQPFPSCVGPSGFSQWRALSTGDSSAPLSGLINLVESTLR